MNCSFAVKCENGSPNRIRTYDPTVNSRLLYHWATEEYTLPEGEPAYIIEKDPFVKKIFKKRFITWNSLTIEDVSFIPDELFDKEIRKDIMIGF